MVMKIHACSFPEAVKLVAGCLGVTAGLSTDPVMSARIAARAAARQQEYEQQRTIKEARIRRKQEEVAASVPGRLARAKPATSEHLYLRRKHLPPFDTKQELGELLIALYCRGHRLVNLERITPEGKKLSLPGGLRRGVYHRFGEESNKVCTCESWSTAASIYLLENRAVRVYAAMGKGNLEAVAMIAKEQNPDSIHFIAADNDTHLPNNPGVMEAVKAAEAIGAVVIIPPSIPDCEKGTDFSDYYLANGGRDAVE
ncbi:toprim domain-containing protein [Endozoicomonadaceae bacterium StTr2]